MRFLRWLDDKREEVWLYRLANTKSSGASTTPRPSYAPGVTGSSPCPSASAWTHDPRGPSPPPLPGSGSAGSGSPRTGDSGPAAPSARSRPPARTRTAHALGDRTRGAVPSRRAPRLRPARYPAGTGRRGGRSGQSHVLVPLHPLLAREPLAPAGSRVTRSPENQTWRRP